ALRDVGDVVVGLAAAQGEDLVPVVAGLLPRLPYHDRVGADVAAIPTPGVARRRGVAGARHRQDGVVVLAEGQDGWIEVVVAAIADIAALRETGLPAPGIDREAVPANAQLLVVASRIGRARNGVRQPDIGAVRHGGRDNTVVVEDDPALDAVLVVGLFQP